MSHWQQGLRSVRARIIQHLLYWLRGIPFTREQLSRLLHAARARELLDDEDSSNDGRGDPGHRSQS